MTCCLLTSAVQFIMIVSLIACSISLTQCYGQFQQCSSNQCINTNWPAAHLPNNVKLVHVQTAAADLNILYSAKEIQCF